MDEATNGPRGRPALWRLAKYDPSWISGIGLVFLFVNSIATIIKNIHEPSTVAFVAFANLDVVLLYVCLSRFDAANPKGKESLKAAVWLLATILTVLFCHRVAGIMPPAVAGIVWGLGAVSISASFYALFVYKDNEAPAAGKV